MSFLSIFILFGVFQGVLLIFAVARKKTSNPVANRLLILFLTIVTITLSAHWLYLNGWIVKFPHIALFLDTLFFLYGPLFYLYIKTLLRADQVFEKRHWLHFIPTAIHILTVLPYAFMPPQDWLNLMQRGGVWQYPYDQGLSIISIAVYLLLSYRKLQQHKSKSPQLAEQIKFLQRIVLATSLCWLAWLHAFTIEVFGWSAGPRLLGYNSVWATLAFLSCFLGYSAIRGAHLFWFEGNRQKYDSSPLSTEEVETLRQRLLKLMAEEKPYLNNKLSLDDLADLMQINKKDLSRIINEKCGTNFFDFVNRYRIDEFKKLATPEALRHRNILALALEAGFNSKTAFNTAFRRLTDTTPSQYLKSIQ